jgi:hypothetical protein
LSAEAEKPSEPKADEPKTDDKAAADEATSKPAAKPEEVEEIGGPKGPEPTRYGDWEKGGRCSDF